MNESESPSSESGLPTQDEIARLSPEARGVFVCRCALRVLPLIGYKGDVSFWGQDAGFYISAIEIAASRAIVKPSDIEKVYFAAAITAMKAANIIRNSNIKTVYGVAADVARNVAEIASYGVRTDGDSAYLAAVDSDIAFLTFISSKKADNIHKKAIRNDCEFLLKEKKPQQLFDQSIWPLGLPREWDDVFTNWLRMLNAIAISDIAGRYKSLLDGKLDNHAYQKAAEEWYSEYQSRETEKNREATGKRNAGNVSELSYPATIGFSFKRFTERARRVIILAREEAEKYRHEYLGTEHILAGILKDSGNLAVSALRKMNVNIDELREEISRRYPEGSLTSGGDIPFTAKAKKVLEYSGGEAESMGHNFIGPEHILLGLIKEKDGSASPILKGFGVHYADMRENILNFFRDSATRPLEDTEVQAPEKENTEKEAEPSENAKIIDDSSEKKLPEISPTGKNFWWINVNPDTWNWKITEMKIGEEKIYPIHNKDGSKRRAYKYFLAARPGELAIGYEAVSTKAVIALFEITKGVHLTPEGEAISFKLKGFFIKQNSLPKLKEQKGLQDAMPIKQNLLGSFFYLTKQEFKLIKKLGEGLLPPVLGTIPTVSDDMSTSDDQLGRESLVKALRDLLDYEDQKGRLTIGLLGHWGAGKSSVLEMLTLRLSSDKDSEGRRKKRREDDPTFEEPTHEFLFGEFNAWSYEHTNNIQAGLAQEVVNSVTGNRWWPYKLWLALDFSCRVHPWRTLITIFFCSFMAWGFKDAMLFRWLSEIFMRPLGIETNILGIGGVIGLFLWLFTQSKELLAHPLAEGFKTYLRLPYFGKHLGELPIIQKHVKDLLDMVLLRKTESWDILRWILRRIERYEFLHRIFWKWVDVSKKRMVFVVDDLDRCGVEGIVKTLEAVRLVMNLENVVVIIAIDPRMALAALANHYHDLAEKGSDQSSRDIARDYLGKILTIPIQLEEPKEGVERYLDKVLFNKIIEEDESDEITKLLVSSKEEENEIKEGGNIEPETKTKTAAPSSPEKEKTIESKEMKADEKIKPGETPAEEIPEVEAIEEPSKESVPVVSEEKEEKPDAKASQKKNKARLEDTILEKKIFGILAQGFELANPRTLKRLHNCFRLIKALEFHKTGKDLSPMERLRCMAMFFWLEHLSVLKKEEREMEEKFMIKGKEEKEEGGEKERKAQDYKPKLTDQNFYPHIKAYLGLSEVVGKSEEDCYKELRLKIQPFLLPWSEKVESEKAERENCSK